MENRTKLIADVAVTRDRSVLMVKYRVMPDRQAGWFLPNDLLQYLEHPDAAASRILAVQLGLADTAPALKTIDSFKGNDGSWHLAFHYLCVLPAAASPAPAAELSEWAWFGLDALPKKSEIAHGGWYAGVVHRVVEGAAR